MYLLSKLRFSSPRQILATLFSKVLLPQAEFAFSVQAL
jgi:hypothetical protein